MKFSHKIALSILVLALSLMVIAPASAERAIVFPGGCCYYNGEIVHTVVNSGVVAPGEGRDNF